MTYQQPNAALLYLPLLVHPDPGVRHQACLLLLGTHGERGITYLRRLLEDTRQQVRQEARLALLSVAEVTDGGVKLQPFSDIYVECLGRLRVYVGNYEMQVADWAQAAGGRAGWQKVQGVLAYLVHCGKRGTSRAALGAAVWGGPYSEHSLARTLSALRQALGQRASQARALEQALVIDGDFCMLDPECYHSDVRLFERAFGMAVQLEQEQGLDAALPLYARALQLYSGPYMAGVAHGSGWCQQRRAHLAGSYLIAAERAAEHAFASREYQRCVDICLLALDADPAADEIVIWLMRAYANEGQRAELEHAYRGYLRAAHSESAGAADESEPVTLVYRALVVAPAG